MKRGGSAWKRGASGSSKAQLQSELEIARVGSAPSLSKLRIVQVVPVGRSISSAQLKIRMVEDIERFGPELQLKPVRNAEGLED